MATVQRWHWSAIVPAVELSGLPSRRTLLRFMVRLLPRDVRRLRNSARWPVAWRAATGRLNEQERAQLEIERRRRAEERAVKRQLGELANEYKRLLVNALARVGVSHVTTEKREKNVSKVRILKPIRVSTEAIYLQVDTARLPWHTNITMLYEPSTLETLSFACRRRVRAIWDKPEEGFWYIVELKMGVRGIPREVDYSKMLDAIKPDAPPLTIPIGIGEAGRMYYRNIADMPHILIGGATNQGKSVWIKNLLCTILLRNDPKRVRMIMIDLKGGVELTQFSTVPHLLIKLIKDKADVLPALEHVMGEVRRRLALFERRHVVNIGGYNQRTRSIMPLWIVVVDELANLMLDKKLRADSETLLADIAAQSRAAGIHLIVATQRPSTDVITGLIKANFPVRVAFSTASSVDSRVIIDTSDATQISPPGRMIFAMGNQKTEVQGPYITPSMVADIVGELAAGHGEEVLERRRKHNITLDVLCRHALEYCDGWFSIEKMWEAFKVHNIQQIDIREMIRPYDGGEIDVDGDLYQIQPAFNQAGRQHPRRLMLLKAAEFDDDSTNEPASNPPTTRQLGPISETVDMTQLTEFSTADTADRQMDVGGNGSDTQTETEEDDGEIEFEIDNCQPIKVVA